MLPEQRSDARLARWRSIGFSVQRQRSLTPFRQQPGEKRFSAGLQTIHPHYMNTPTFRALKFAPWLTLLALTPGGVSSLAAAATPEVPAWAQPGSATHTQVAPPADFH